MGEIHKLTERLLPGEADPELVAALEELTERARRGEISALAWAGYNPNDTMFNGWQGAGGTMFHLGAAILSLHARYGIYISEPDE